MKMTKLLGMAAALLLTGLIAGCEREEEGMVEDGYEAVDIGEERELEE